MKISRIVVGLLFALLTSVSFANQATLFRNSSGDGWSAFEQDLQKEGLLKNGVFPTAVLTELAYDYAKRQKLPAGELGGEEFKKLFLLSNNFGETIAVTEFRQLGQAGKIVVPDLVPRAANLKTEATATQVAVAPVAGPTLPASPDAKQDLAIAKMEAQVKTLQAEVQKSSGQKEAATALAKQLATFGKELQALKNGQGGFAQRADLDAAKVEFAKLKGSVDALLDLQTEVTGIKASQSSFEGRLAAAEQNPILAWGSTFLGSLLVFALLCVGVAIALWMRVNKVKVVADTAIKTANTAAEDVAVLHGEIGTRDIKIQDGLELQLRALREQDEMLSTVTVDGEAKVLRFTRANDGVKIEGIESQSENISVRIENVRKRIKRAAGARDLVGLKNGVDAVNAQPLRAVR